MNQQLTNNDPAIEPVTRALRQLSPNSQQTVAALVRQLAESEGVNMPSTQAPGLQTPTDGVPLWLAKLRAGRYSPRTVHMYGYLAGKFLEGNPAPTRLDVQQHLAYRLETVSPALVSNERKALASLFSFLHSEGLSPSNPITGVGHVRVRYSERPCPDLGDVLKVMETGCARRRDTDKLRLIVLLLATTGIRISEAATLLRENVDLGAMEIRVRGKGEKWRTVPLLPITAKAIRDYIKRYSGDSPYLFPSGSRAGHLNIHNPEKTLRRACVRAGVRPFTPHQLRHLYATHMLRGGAKLEVVARILGHASVGVTADIYRHVTIGELREENGRFAPLSDDGAMLER